MNEHERSGGPGFDRLAAADPARHAPEPVEGVLRAKVDALIGHTPAGQDQPEPTVPETDASGAATSGSDAARVAPRGSGEPDPVDEVAVRRHRRRAPWLVAAAVAGIVAVGGGGYLAGEAGLGTTQATSDAASSDAVAPKVAEAPSTLSKPAPEGVQPLDVGGSLPTATRLVFRAGVGLSDAPSTAEVLALDGSNTESLGSYPVISEVQAVERLGDPRYANTTRGAQPPRPDGAESSAEAPEPGGSIAWPVEDVTITSATMTKTRYTLPDGAVLRVPAYTLTDAAGSSWTVLAVDEEQLDFTP